jgi:hypothetical protein
MISGAFCYKSTVTVRTKAIKPFPTNRKFDLTAGESPIRTAKEPWARDLEYRGDGVQPSQWKSMESLNHPVKNKLTPAIVLNSSLHPCISDFF